MYLKACTENTNIMNGYTCFIGIRRIGSGKVANVIVDNGKDDDEDDTFVVDDIHLQQNHIDAVS